MNSVLVRFKNKNYYVKYDDLLNKANNKLFAYEDEELKVPAKYNGGTLTFDKSELEDKLKKDIKMPTRMPSALKTEQNQENEMNSEQKLRKYIREQVIKMLKEDDPYGQPDEALYLFKTGDDYLQGIQGDSVNEEGEQPSAEELAAKQKAAKEKARKIAYQQFFSRALAKFGYSSVASIPDEKKKEFFDYVDANWTSKQEQPKQKKESIVGKNISEASSLIAKTDDDKGNPVYVKSLTPNLVMTDKKDEAMKFDNKLQFSQILRKYGYSDRFYELVSDTLAETSATGGVAGYETPRAFTGKKGISKKQKSIANQLGYELVDKSYAVKDQGDTQDLNESYEQMDTREMLEKLQFSENEAVAEVAKRVLEAPDFNKQVQEELRWSGGFLTSVLKGDYESALRKADGYNYRALTGKNKFQGDSEYLQEKVSDAQQQFYKKIMDVLLSYDENSCISDTYYDEVAFDIVKLLSNSGLMEMKLNEGIDSLYLKDESLTPEQKLGLAMRHVRNNLYEVEKVIQKTIKMKNEQSIDSTKVGKRTYQALKRINEKVIRLMVALNDLK